MAETIGDQGNNYVNLPTNAAGGAATNIIYEGYVYKWNGAGLTIITGKTDTAFAIAAKSTRDPQLNTAMALALLDNWAFFLLGSGELVNVASIASQTWKNGAKVYIDDSIDGMVTTDLDTNAKCIGHYKGKESLVTSATDGDLIQVILDQPSTSATA